MSEPYDRERDVAFLHEEIVAQGLGPYDISPRQPLKFDLSTTRMRVAYGAALGFWVAASEIGRISDAAASVEEELEIVVPPDLARAISWSALRDVCEIYQLGA
jgi:hypothetical protein